MITDRVVRALDDAVEDAKNHIDELTGQVDDLETERPWPLPVLRARGNSLRLRRVAALADALPRGLLQGAARTLWR